MQRYLLKGGTIVTHNEKIKKDVLIEGERILQVETDIKNDLSVEIIDCHNQLIFPGIIDTHTHMGIPIKSGYSIDGFESGSKSAIHGGVTTILDFTILKHNQTLIESITSRKKQATKSICDYSFHCNITYFSDDILSEIPNLIKDGINSFKVFTTYEEAGMMLTYDEIYKIAQVISDNNGILMVHAEDNDILKEAMIPFSNRIITEPIYHARSRPDEAEEKAIRKLGEISDETGCLIYIVHISSARGLKIAKQFNNLIIETCPQYLLLDETAYNRGDGRMFVASPPLRKTTDNKRLWDGLIEEHILTIGTDHCPFLTSDKLKNIHFTKIPNGMGGIETLFPILLAKWIKSDLDLKQLSKILSYNPAKIFGLSDRKGNIKSGIDADLVVINPNDISTNWDDNLVSVTDWNAYVKFPAIFPTNVFRRGNWVIKNSQLHNVTNGKYLKNMCIDN
jgi:dihydropyrimidinase